MRNIAEREIWSYVMDDLAEDIAEEIVDFIEDYPGLQRRLQTQAMNKRGFMNLVIRKLIEEVRD